MGALKLPYPMLPACQPAPRGQIKFLEPKTDIEHIHRGGGRTCIARRSRFFWLEIEALLLPHEPTSMIETSISLRTMKRSSKISMSTLPVRTIKFEGSCLINCLSENTFSVFFFHLKDSGNHSYILEIIVFPWMWSDIIFTFFHSFCSFLMQDPELNVFLRSCKNIGQEMKHL